MFWSNTLSTTGEKHLFQTDQNAILKILEDIKQNRLKNPTILAISKKTERALYQGNHCMAALLNKMLIEYH